MTKRSPTFAESRAAAVAFLANLGLSSVASAQTAKTFIDYVQPTPITCSPLSSATWGVAGVLPRDTCNGIESAKGAGIPPDYYYWDGKIIAAKETNQILSFEVCARRARRP